MRNKFGFVTVTIFNFGALVYTLQNSDTGSFWSGFSLGVSFTLLAAILLED